MTIHFFSNDKKKIKNVNSFSTCFAIFACDKEIIPLFKIGK